MPKAWTLRIKKYNRRAEGTPDMNKRMNQHGHIKCCKWVPWQHLDGSWFVLYFHRQRNIKFSFRRHILYSKINLLVEGTTITNTISKVFVPKSRKQYSRNKSHGNTLPEVNCNRYLPSKFVPKIRHVILNKMRYWILWFNLCLNLFCDCVK